MIRVLMIRMIHRHFLYLPLPFCSHLIYVGAYDMGADDMWAFVTGRREDYPHPLPSIVFLRQIQVDGFVKHLMLRCAFVFQLFKCTSRNSEEWVKRFIMEVWNHFLKISSHLFRTLIFKNFYDAATSFEGYSL